MISLFLPARLGNKFNNFCRWFESLSKTVDDKNNIEILVKFDDDEDVSAALQIVEKYQKDGFAIKYIKTPRGRGYNDISFFYAQLFLIANPKSKMMMAGSIDLVFRKKGFDKILIEASKKFEEDNIFVIHTTFTGNFSNQIKNINMATQSCDNFPIWSRRWIEICGAHFGYCSSNDGYTGIVEYFLSTQFGIDRRIDISGLNVFRESNIASIGSDYWNNQRRSAMEINISESSIALALQTAKNLAYNISNAINENQHTSFLIKSCLDSYDELLKKGHGEQGAFTEIDKIKKRIKRLNTAMSVFFGAILIIAISFTIGFFLGGD